MSATVSQNITIRDDAELTVYRGAALSGATYYHGTYILLGPDGYWRNGASTVIGAKGVGILASMKFTDQVMDPTVTAGTMTATANGSLVNNTNCFDIYVGGEFEGIFETTTTMVKANEGDIVYIYDNNTLTINPAFGLFPIGRLTKFKSASTGSVRLAGIQLDLAPRVIRGALAGQVSDTSGFVVKSIANPFGANVIVRGFSLGVQTSGSTAHTGYAGISPTSSNVVGLFVMSSSSLNFGLIGIQSPNNDPITYSTLGTTSDGSLDRIWKTSEYFTITGSSSGVATFVGWYQIDVAKY